MRRSIKFIAILFLLACKDVSTQPPGPYDSMLFHREGAGDKVFNAYPTTSTDTFQVVISRYEFRDTSVHLTLIKDNTNASAFDALTQTLSGQIKITGDSKQSTLPTGTWIYLYVVKGAGQTQITNITLVNLLSTFENMVKAKM